MIDGPGVCYCGAYGGGVHTKSAKCRLQITDDIKKRFLAYHDKNPAWGWLHVVLDDDNVDDADVKGCIDDARKRGDAEAVALGELLLQMTKTQRRKIGSLPY